MIKNTLLFIIIFCASLISNAQGFDQPAVQELSDKVCECIQTKGTIETQAKAEMELGTCMLQAYTDRKDYFDKKGLTFLEGNNAEKLGEQVGLTLAASCPEAIPLFMLFTGDEEEMELEESVVFMGKIIKTNTNQFTIFEIKDEDGRKRKAVWLTYVDNDELLEEAKNGKGSYIFTCIELDIYDPRIGEYRNMLVLDKIDKK